MDPQGNEDPWVRILALRWPVRHSAWLLEQQMDGWLWPPLHSRQMSFVVGQGKPLIYGMALKKAFKSSRQLDQRQLYARPWCGRQDL